MSNGYLFTSESVSEGHPDKVADQISDAIVDLFLSKDPEARVACETMTTTNRVVLAGEIRGEGIMDQDGNWAPGIREEIEQAVRSVVKSIGYEQEGFHWDRFDFANHLHPQSAHIAQGVDAGEDKDEGAGDQGIMFGFACDETPDLMPATLYYSHKILMEMAKDRHSGAAPFLEPDAKSQVTLRFEDGMPAKATAIVVSSQHSPLVTQQTMREDVVEKIIQRVIPAELMDENTKIYVNPTGRFVVGGPHGDAGVTGRKIIVDTYGGAAPHGGGAFSGKDPTKVDRSACYMARYVAKNVVAAGLAEKCMVQLAYAIGVAEPVSVYIETAGTGTIPDEKISELVRAHFKLTPKGIIESLNLRRPIYKKTAAYGHFGRRLPEFTWERTDKAAALKSDARL